MNLVKQEQKPNNFDDLVAVERLKIEVKKGKSKLKKSKDRKSIKKNSRILKAKENRLLDLRKKLGANKL